MRNLKKLKLNYFSFYLEVKLNGKSGGSPPFPIFQALAPERGLDYETGSHPGYATDQTPPWASHFML